MTSWCVYELSNKVYRKMIFLDFTPNVPYLKIGYMGKKWGKLGIRSKIKFITRFKIPTPNQKCSQIGACVENHIRNWAKFCKRGGQGVWGRLQR